METAERYVYSEKNRLGGLTQSHAYWTDLINHTNDKDNFWIQENATEYLFKDTSARSYRNPMHPEEALAIITEGAGSHFDPQLVDTFQEIAQGTYERWSNINRSPEAFELVES